LRLGAFARGIFFMKKADIQKFQTNLISWYNDEFRDLPWRQTSNPYNIWISEIMLQQTQVKKVIPYYERFIEAFPTVKHLADADLDNVLKLWEGLGYYARARNLYKAAKVVVEQFNNTFPTNVEDVKSLPGIGDYSAAAIMSIAYGADMPVIDGNVNRVLSRLFRVDVDPKSTEGRQLMQQKAELLFAHGQAGTYNQAIMELGAMICTPKSPKCLLCPVNDLCEAQQYNQQSDYPVKSPKKQRPHKQIAVGIVFKGNEILIDQRKPEGMLGGLWEFPGGHVQDGESHQQAVVREVKEELDVDVVVKAHFATIEHQYSHFTISLHAYLCDYKSGRPKAIECDDWKWVKKEELLDYAFPRANGKIIEKLLAE
jgi:A/G-specific adenine glycosylase